MKKTYIARCLSLEFTDPRMRGYYVFKIGSSAFPEGRVQQLTSDIGTGYEGETFLLEAKLDKNIERPLQWIFDERRLEWKKTRELFFFTPVEIDAIIKEYGFSIVNWEYDKKHLTNL